ncbi:putative nuclease HARBI1 [Tanacetum coccineum]
MSDYKSDDSDVQDFKDLDMIFELGRLEQQEQEEAERVHHRNYIYRERVEAEARYENYIETHYPLSPHFDFFRVRPDATGIPGFSVIMKCTSAIRQLAYGVTPDSLDYIDCMHWEWKNCPKAWPGQFGRGDKKYPTILLEDVASYDL